MKKGFTIIEALVAIAILTVTITGAMSAVQSGISSYIYSKDQVVAFYLAQEAFEQIRNIRDANALSGNDWQSYISGTNDPCLFGEACIVDAIGSPTLTRCSSPGNCPKLRQDPQSGFYGHNSSWTETIFRREVVLSSLSPNEIVVTVTVSWNKGSTSRQFRARENLFNWH